MALVAQYKLSNTAGSILTDDSGNSYDLTTTGTVSNATGFQGATTTAISIAGGTGNHLSISDPTNVSGQAVITVLYRVKFASFAALQILGGMGGVSPNYEFLIGQVSTAGKIKAYVSTNGTSVTYTTESTALSTGVWYDIAFEYDGTNINIYVDDMSAAVATAAKTGSIYNSSGSLYIGSNTNGANCLNGTMDDVEIYNSTLTQSEKEARFALNQDFTPASPSVTTTGGFVLGGSSSTVGTEILFVTSGGFVLGGSQSSVLSGNSVEVTTTGGFVLGGSSSTIGAITSITTTGGFVIGGTGSSLATTTVANYQDVLWGLFTGQGDAITGAAPTVKLYNETTGQLFDFNDSVFQSSGWTTLADTMTEIDATNLAGYYKTRLEVSLFSDGRYDALMTYAAGTPKQNTGLSFSILDGEVVDEYAAAQATAIKTKTDSLTFTVAGEVDANIHSVNDVPVTGVGSDVDPWNP